MDNYTKETPRVPWIVNLVPVGENPVKDASKNKGGLVVNLTNGDETHEVHRVAYVRENSKSPELTFEDALQAEVDKAQLAADEVNKFEDELQELLDQATTDAKNRIREALGRPARSAKPA